MIFLLGGAALYKCDGLTFNYHSFDPGQDCTTIGWNYVRRTCIPEKFTLQAFESEALMSRQYSSPQLSLNASTPVFSFPTDTIRDRDGDLHFAVTAVNARGVTCNVQHFSIFYSFTVPIKSGRCKHTVHFLYSYVAT